MPTMAEPEVIPAQKRAGRIIGLFVTADMTPKGFETGEAASLTLDLQGVPGSRHHGWTRPSDSRVPYLPRGTPMRNVRQLSIVSIEDLAQAAKQLGIPKVDPKWIGASVLVEGIERFAYLPRGTHLFCDGGAILIVEHLNDPCRGAGASIARHNPDHPEIEFDFVKKCARLRGVVATIEHPGTLSVLSAITARLPEHWVYR